MEVFILSKPFTKSELEIMSVALWQLQEALDISKEHWEYNEELKKKNKKDLEIIEKVLLKLKERLEKFRNE